MGPSLVHELRQAQTLPEIPKTLFPDGESEPRYASRIAVWDPHRLALTLIKASGEISLTMFLTRRKSGRGPCRGDTMDFEKYTDRARGFVQSAQSLALREGHQQFAPEHLLKVLLDDAEGLAAGLIDRSGGRSREALAEVEKALGALPKVSGSGAGQVYLAPALARVFDTAEKT